MVQLVVDTPEGISLRYEIAGAGSRGAAAVIDLLVFVSIFLCLLVLVVVLSTLDPTGISAFAAGLLGGGFLICLSLYQVAFALLWNGGSPGKRILGIRVVDQEGSPANAVQHLVRGLFWPIEIFLTMPVSLGLILIAATERRQRLGDMVAGTLVLREAPPDPEPEPFAGRSWSDLPEHRLALSPALAARFDADDLGYLRRLLSRQGAEPGARGRLLQKSARHYAAALGLELSPGLPPEQAGEFLRELYLYLRELRRPQSS